MTSDFFAGWSAVLAVLGFGGLLFGLWRLHETWGENRRRAVLLLGGVGVAYGIGCHQAMTWWSYEMHVYNALITDPWTIVLAVNYRAGSTLGLLAFGGAVTYPRCGHKGWLSLVGVGAIAWLVSWVV